MLLGLVINVINSWRANERMEALLGEHGIAGIIIFIGIVMTAFHFLGITIIPGILVFPNLSMKVLTSWPFFVLIFGLILLILKSVIEKEGILNSFGPIIEDLVGFLVNILSFARIAGFAIAHAALAIVVHEMLHANLAIGIGMGLIFLNFFSLTIELLVVMIQALRLLFYEFSTKFFKGTGKTYDPFKL
jgi:V/A-type H+-transporting ATPase subunit I